MSSWAEKPASLAIGALSAFFRVIGARACRFEPSCSVYATGAFKKFSFFKALRLSVSRLLRCHPLNKGGFDPLP
jgi:putative membrane protein insertion efficiency factor